MAGEQEKWPGESTTYEAKRAITMTLGLCSTLFHLFLKASCVRSSAVEIMALSVLSMMDRWGERQKKQVRGLSNLDSMETRLWEE